MEKNFDLWNNQKKKTHAAHTRPMFKEREVWWCSMGVNVGDEQDGKGASFARPVLVLKKFNQNIFVGIPLSTQLKNKPYYYPLHFNGKEQSLILSQIRLMDARRFGIRMGDIPLQEIEKIKERLKKILF